MNRGEPFKLSTQAIASATNSRIWALDLGAVDSMTTLSALHPNKTGSKTDAPVTVAVVRIDGPLSQRGQAHMCGYVDGYDWIAGRLESALTSDAGAVALVIDSPGGDVAGLEEAVKRMQDAKAASGKPIVVYVDELAASAAYWIAAALGDQIVAPVAARTGSIGVIAAYADESKALKMQGVSLKVFRAPAGKAPLMSAAPNHEVASVELTALVARTSRRFFASMAEARGMNAKDVEALDASLFGSEAAQKNGLIDVVGGFGDAVSLAASLAKQREDMEELESIRVAMGLAEDAEVAKALVPMIGFAQKALELTGESNSGKALLAIKSGITAKADLAEREDELEAAERAMEATERASLYRQIVESGAATSAAVFEPCFDESEAPKPRKAYANMSIEDLREQADAVDAPSAKSAQKTYNPGSAKHGVDLSELAAQHGISQAAVDYIAKHKYEA